MLFRSARIFLVIFEIIIIQRDGFPEHLAITEARRAADATLPVTTWTHFRVSESYDIHHLEEDSEDGSKLVSVIRSILSA